MPYDGQDELEPESGGGWMRLIDKETLEGYGHEPVTVPGPLMVN